MSKPWVEYQMDEQSQWGWDSYVPHFSLPLPSRPMDKVRTL